jgi:membrane protein DedA with SNARE-associated domain
VEDLLLRFAGLPSWQIALTAGWLLLQGCILPSVPEEIVIATLGMLRSQGRISLSVALVAVLTGLLPANSGTVFIGHRLASGLASWGPFSRAFGSRTVQDALASIRRRGRGLVFVTRFTPLVRGPVYLAAGLAQMSVRRFFLVDATAACIQVPLLLWLGARMGQGTGSLAEAWQRIGYLAASLAAAALALQILRRLRGRRTGVGERAPTSGPPASPTPTTRPRCLR